MFDRLGGLRDGPLGLANVSYFLGFGNISLATQVVDLDNDISLVSDVLELRDLAEKDGALACWSCWNKME